MPTGDDRASARIRFEGEAKRLWIRRPRFDRDGLYLFGPRHAGQTVTLSTAEVTALFEGRTLAVDVYGEYILYVRVDGAALDAVGLLGAMNGVRREQRRGGPGTSPIPQREDPGGAQPTYSQQRRPRVKTPEWIVELAKRDIGR
jgi:hypothetical protein